MRLPAGTSVYVGIFTSVLYLCCGAVLVSEGFTVWGSLAAVLGGFRAWRVWQARTTLAGFSAAKPRQLDGGASPDADRSSTP